MPNHTSDQHPRFEESRDNASSAKRDWYIWRDGAGQSPPNNWGREKSRAPIPWNSETDHGWNAEPWLPMPPEAGNRNVAEAMRDERSILHLYRRLLQMRRSSRALRDGTWRPLGTAPGVLSYERACGDEVKRVIANFMSESVSVELEDDWYVELATDTDVRGAWNGTLRAEEAVVLRLVS